MKLLASMFVAAALLASPAAFAQQTAARVAPAAQLQPPEWTEADGRAVLNARLAALRTVIEMTPEQERLWSPVEAAIRDIGRGAIERRNRRQVAQPPANFLDVLGAIADSEQARGEALRKFVDAGRPFVASLSEGQRRRVPAFLGMTDHGGPGQPSGQLWLFEEEEG